jgi:hypothetical protein
VRDQYGVVVREHGAILLHEVEQMGHLFEIGRHVAVVAPQMRIVELDMDDVLDLAARGVETATGLCGSQRRYQHCYRHHQRHNPLQWMQ